MAKGDEGGRTVDVGVGETEVVVTVATVADAVAETSGEVTGEVLEGFGYTMGSQRSAGVRVTDAPDTEPTVTDTGGVLLSVFTIIDGLLFRVCDGL